MNLRSLLSRFLWMPLAAALVTVALPVSATATPDLTPTAEQQQATVLITQILTKYHYRSTPLDDALSGAILDRYIESLDPNRSYFQAADIKEFERYRTRLDDSLKAADLSPAYAIFDRYLKRLRERVDHARELLSRHFDFNRDETYQVDRSKADWAADRAALDEIWRQRVKNDFLSLRLTGLDDGKIRDKLTKRYETLYQRSEQINAGDVFQRFMNAYTESVEPHTAYFSPRTSENFRINMSLSLEGIGAVLQNENEYTMVRKVVPGGPAEKCGQLHAGDRIVGVGQGADEEVEDVVGWRLDDVVDLIRGPKETTVRLQVLPKDAGPDGPTRTISIVRNRIVLEEQAAKSSVRDVIGPSGPTKIGVIELPAFYLDFDARARGDKDYRSTTRDVRKLITELQQQGISGLIMDLRGNGGGSLEEATELTGLFIPTGPVVQVRDSRGRIEVDEDPNPDLAYAGPLAVLVDTHSASASEIFAGAIQDYHRGLVIGTPTYGKGTVQSIIDLDRLTRPESEGLGQLKVTIAQFFRVSGSSTQHRGVIPDIRLPTAKVDDDQRESGLSNALPWASVRAVSHQSSPVDDRLLKTLVQRHEERVKSNAAYQILEEQIAQQQALSRLTTVTLQESKRRAEQDAREAEQLAQENRFRTACGVEPLAEAPKAADAEDDVAADEPEQDPRLDVVLTETAHIVADLTQLKVLGGEVHTADSGSAVRAY